MSTRTENPTARPAVAGVKGARILIVESRYYADIADALIKGAEQEIVKNGAKADRVVVPGAFEIPARSRWRRTRRASATTATWRSAASFAARPRTTTTFVARARGA